MLTGWNGHRPRAREGRQRHGLTVHLVRIEQCLKLFPQQSFMALDEHLLARLFQLFVSIPLSRPYFLDPHQPSTSSQTVLVPSFLLHALATRSSPAVHPLSCL